MPEPDEQPACDALAALGARLRLRRSGRVHTVDLSSPAEEVADEALAHLASLSTLARLELAGTQVTDQGLTVLGKLERLEHLDLRHTAVTDAGLEHLEGLKGLKLLLLTGTRVTREGVARVRPAMINTRIVL